MQINTKYQSREIEDFLVKSRGSNIFRTSFFKLYFLGFQSMLNTFFRKSMLLICVFQDHVKKDFAIHQLNF